MTFRIGGAKKRRDTSERAIIDALRAVGVQIWQLSGRGLPDILALYRDRYYVFEVKTKGGRRTAQQQAIPWPIVQTVADAFTVLGIRLPSPTKPPQPFRMP